MVAVPEGSGALVFRSVVDHCAVAGLLSIAAVAATSNASRRRRKTGARAAIRRGLILVRFLNFAKAFVLRQV